MPEELPVTEQTQEQSSTTELAEPSPEALAALETENAALKAANEEKDKQANALRESMVKMMAQPAPAAPQVDDASELIAGFVEDGLNDVAAKAIAKRMLAREAKMAERFVARDQYARDSQAVSEIAVDALTRKEMDRLEEEGYAPADVKKVNDWVQKERQNKHYFHSAEDAFDLGVKKLGIAKPAAGEESNVDEAKARKIAKQAQGNMHGASRGGGPSQGPISPPKHLTEPDLLKDHSEWTRQTQEWVNTLTPEQRKRVKW